jgi:5-formyltetrahydrofolate cyclo-ligase
MRSTKQAIRAEVKRRIGLLQVEERQQESAAVVQKLLGCGPVKAAQRVGLYAALKVEVNVEGLVGALLKEGKQVYLPVIDEADKMVFSEIHSAAGLAELQPHKLGFSQPHLRKETEEWKQLDVVVVPGRAFDRGGGRMGWGKGYYDKALNQLRADCVKIGVCFSCQIWDQIPQEPHDIPMDLVMTGA